MRAALRAVGLVALAAGAIIVFFFLIQNRLIFHPSPAIEATPDFFGMQYEDVRLRTSDGETIAGWHIPAEAPLATLLFLHGNAGNISHRLHSLAALRRAGFTLLIIDYRGYGQSSGSPSEEGIHLDAAAAWEHLTQDRGLRPAGIVLYGESIGSVPAFELARRLERKGEEPPAAVVVDGALTSALEVGRRTFPFLPVRWILRSRLDNLAAVREVSVPTLFIHAREDEIIPLDMGRRLYEASAAPLKEFHEVPMAYHNTLWATTASELPGVIRRFVQRAMKP